MINYMCTALFLLCVCVAGAGAQTILAGEYSGEPDKEGWSLNGGTGERTYIEEVTFEKAFTVPPRVLVSLSGYDATAGPDNTVRLHASAFRVTKTGVTLRVKTWGEGRVGSVWGNWIAVGVK
ncbi:hypothetical protein ANRL2_02007 [Anaerolineae bacterium]|nr:hypothetical protein ANRL2_02007 [Anaerolineae bacterium]